MKDQQAGKSFKNDDRWACSAPRNMSTREYINSQLVVRNSGGDEERMERRKARLAT